MLDKLVKAFDFLKADVKGLKETVAKLEKVHPIVKEGKPGRDGKDAIAPSVEDIVAAVLEQIPTPKDGVSPDAKAIVDDVLAAMPKPRDGRDAPVVSVSDVAAIVLAKIEKPKDGKPGKDGRNGPDLETVVKRVKAQVQDGRPGDRGPKGDKGEKGDKGVSVTDVQLNNNDLFVFLDGKKQKVGSIKVPTPSAPFNPGNAGGGGTARTSKTVGYTSQGTFVSGDLQVGALDTPQNITFGAGGTTAEGGATIAADGVITVNDDGFWSIKQRFRAGRSGASGVSELFFWAEISVDGGNNWAIIGNAVDIPLSSSNDVVIFFDLSDLQVPPGTKFRNRFARSSTGNDSGDLRVGVPSAALAALGVPDAPSSQATFYKIDQ